jgi:hypothetical protein
LRVRTACPVGGTIAAKPAHAATYAIIHTVYR